MDYVGLVSTVGLIVPDDGDALAELLTDLCGVEFVHVSHFIECERENPALQGWDESERRTREGISPLASPTCIFQ